MNRRLLPCGPTAVVVEVDTTDEALDLADTLRAGALGGVIDLVPAARTVLIECDSPSALGAIMAVLDVTSSVVTRASIGALITIDTVYDGDDLSEVAATAGLSVAEVIDLHVSADYKAAFCGFAPGFMYLTGLHPLLHVGRRASPRPRVPAGSVAIATEFTGVYPTASPGGWNLLGRTTAVMWDATRERPAYVEPGDTVRFVAVGR